MSRISSSFLPTVLVLFIVQGCTKDTSVTTPPPIDYGSISTISYAQHVQPLLSRSCATGGCHDATSSAAGLILSSWEEIIKGSQYGESVVPFSPEKSLLTILFEGVTLRRQHPALSAPFSSVELSFLKRWILEGAKNDAGAVPYATSPRRLYVPNQADDNVAIIDIDNLVVRRYVKVGNMPANDAPHYIVANNQYWYVSLIGTGEVWKFDAQTDTLVGTVKIQGSPALLELTPDGSKLYVSQFMTSSTNRISVVNTATMTVASTIQVWTMPHGMRINQAGTRLYVANMLSDNISVVDVATDQVLDNVALAHDASPFGPPKYMPMEIAISPNDSLVMVTCSERREVRVFLASSMALVDSYAVGDQPWHLQFTPDGQLCFVANRRGHSVSVIHIPMGHVMTVIDQPTLFSSPHGCDVSRNGQYIFVSSENIFHGYTPRYAQEYVGNVAVIDPVTSQIVKTIEVGRMPTGISVSR
jgi:YVTN family beta-propeller protein